MTTGGLTPKTHNRTSTVEPYEHNSQSATEKLLERSWETRKRRASHRELIVDVIAAVLFGAAAGALLSWGGAGALRPGIAALLIAVYALVVRIEFPVGASYVVPTQLILVPMLLMLPPAAVPLAVACGLVIGSSVDCALSRIAPRRVLSAIPDAWHSIGPAAVLLLAGSPVVGFGELPLLALALATGCLVDLATSLIRTRLAGVLPDAPCTAARVRDRLGRRRCVGATRLPRRDCHARGRHRDPVCPTACVPAVAGRAGSQPAHRSGIPSAQSL